MSYFPNLAKKFVPICTILFVTLLIKLWWYEPHPPFWDGAVYLSMGKYLFSGGQVGLIEPFRPIIWPAILGLFWKLGGDPIFVGRILEMIFSLGNIGLVYLIGQRVYDQKTALIATFFFSLSPTYFFWENNFYSDIPGSFLGLLVVYLFLQKQFFLSGIVGGLAFFMRFTQIIPIVLLGGFHVVERSPLRLSLSFVRYVLGLIISTVPFVVAYFRLYGDMFSPLKEAKEIYGQVLVYWHQEILFCLKMFFRIEGWIFIFVPLSIIAFRRNASKQKLMLLLIGIVSFVWVGKLPIYLDLPRFFIASLPYLYLLSADGISNSYRFIKKHSVLSSYLFSIVIVILVGMQFLKISNIHFPRNKLNIFQLYAQQNEKDIKGPLWISDPTAVAFSDLKVDELMYYPIFDSKKISTLRSNLSTANYIFWDSRALPCRPKDDLVCEEAKQDLLNEIKKDFKPEVYFENPAGTLTQGIFKRPVATRPDIPNSQ